MSCSHTHQFCIACGVSLDLHPYEGESDDLAFECGIAVRKAELLASSDHRRGSVT